MIAVLFRRALCRAGRHHVLRCAGAEDHAWAWDPAGERWTAALTRVSPLTPTAPDQPVRADAAPAGKNDLAAARHRA